MSQTQTMPQISGSMMLFERPELLNKEQHGGLGLKQLDGPYRFCSKIKAIPLTLGELSFAMKSYPIAFVSAEQPIPIAILGAIDDVNLFVDDQGNWESTAYIPAYIRRYPFAMAGETGGERFAVVLDTGFEGVVQGGDIPLFVDGEPSDQTKRAIEFCQQYEADKVNTERAMATLAEFDIVVGQTVQYTPTGQTEQVPFAQFFAIDETKLQEMSDEKFLELRKTGLLPVVYAHLLSVSNWRALMNRRANRFQLDESNLLKPVAQH